MYLFEDVRIKDEEEERVMAALKPTLAYGQIPLYEEEGVRLVQSMTIVRFLARRGGLYGKSDHEAALIDQVLDGVTDIRTKRDPLRYFDEIEESVKNARVTKFYKEVLPQWAGYLEHLLGDQQWFTENFSIADIAVFNWLSVYHGTNPESFANTPRLVAHIARVAARPGIAAWLAKRPQSSW